MDDAAASALADDLVIDITTTGRSSGEQRRLEIWIHELDGRYYITGSPGTRSWYANLLKDPAITVHLKKSHSADLSGRATAVTAVEEKRRVLRTAKALVEHVTDENEADWLSRSPLVEVIFD